MIVSNASVWSKYVDLLLCKKGVIHLKKSMFFFKTWTFFKTWIYFVFQPNALEYKLKSMHVRCHRFKLYPHRKKRNEKE